MSSKKKKPEADPHILRGEKALEALAAEARRRRTTYGKLVAALDNEEMIRIVWAYLNAQAGKKWRRKCTQE